MTGATMTDENRKEKEDYARFEKDFAAASKVSQSTFTALMTIRLAIESSGLDAGQKKDVCYAAIDMHTAFVVKNTLEALAEAILSSRDTDPKMVLALILEESDKRFDKAARKSSMMLGMLGESFEGERQCGRGEAMLKRLVDEDDVTSAVFTVTRKRKR